MLARTLQKRGHEVVFIIDDEQRLNRPENRYHDINTPYPNWIKDFSPFPLWLVGNLLDGEKKSNVIKLLNTCDFIILNGYAIRFSNEINAPHITALTGSDLKPLADFKHADDLMRISVDLMYKENILIKKSKQTTLFENKIIFSLTEKLLSLFNYSTYTNKEYFKPKAAFHNLIFLASYKNWLKKEIKRQRNSIKNAFTHLFFIEGIVPEGDKLLAEIGANKKKLLSNLMIDVDSIEYFPVPNNQIIRIFNLARFNWKKESNQPKDFLPSMDYKGNDIMIKGLAAFCKKFPTQNLNIRLVKKGKDVEKTIELCKELGISNYVTWLDELSQKEVLEEYKQADIVFDQLDKSLVAMGGFEVMALGRPLIANARPEIFDKFLGEKTVICQAETPEEVCSWLEKLVFDKNLRQEIGKKSRQFVEKHFSTETMANRVLEAFNKTGHNK